VENQWTLTNNNTGLVSSLTVSNLITLYVYKSIRFNDEQEIPVYTVYINDNRVSGAFSSIEHAQSEAFSRVNAALQETDKRLRSKVVEALPGQCNSYWCASALVSLLNKNCKGS
jgi:hypothetical protein